MQQANGYAQSSAERTALTGQFAISAFTAFFAFALLFTVAPKLDLVTANLFFSPQGGFIGLSAPFTDFRLAFKLAYISICAFAIAGLVLSLVKASAVVGLTLRKWLFLCLCLSLGPGLVCNVLFKDEWGRARPSQITEFGGTQKFTPALQTANQCKKNCSFTSGEASSIFMIFFAFAFLFRKRFSQWILTGIAMGFLAGLIRMAQGGHFLSDVIFAGITMALVAAALDHLMGLLPDHAKFAFWPSRARPTGPIG